MNKKILDPEAYRRILAESVNAGIPGVQVFVKAAEMRWWGAAGLASVEEDRAMQVDGRLRLASITKMLTYAAVEEMIKQGRLARSDLAVEYLPTGVLDGIPYAGEMTVAHLLDHTSGMHNFNGEDGQDFFTDLFSSQVRGKCGWTPTELLKYARKPEHPPTGRPGVGYFYSSSGYLVLQMILESLGDASFGTVLRRLLFEPLGMTASGVEGDDLAGPHILPSYARPRPEDMRQASVFTGRSPVRDDGLVNLSAGLSCYNAWAQAAGAAASNVLDLGRFIAAVESGRVTVLHRQRERFAKASKTSGRTLSWNGGSWGIQTSILYEPQRSLWVIVLTTKSTRFISQLFCPW